jgi:hypothetical protein
VVAVHAQAALGRNDHVIAFGAFPQRLAEQLFGRAEAIPLRRVEEVDPQRERVMDCVPAVVEVGRTPIAAEFPGAECDCRNLQVGLS